MLVLGVWGADLFGFKPAAVWFMRFLTGSTVLCIAWYFLYLPLRVRVDDVAVAQFIEEKYPQLEDRLVTAIEYGNRKTPDSGMIDLLIQDALKQDVARRFFDIPEPATSGRLRNSWFRGCPDAFRPFDLGPVLFPLGFQQSVRSLDRRITRFCHDDQGFTRGY